MNIPMSSPDLTDAEVTAVNEVLHTRFLSIGPKINAFEQGFADYTGTQYGIGVNSGTSGLHLCMIAAGVGEGDFVITTPFSFIASANCALYERATPLFVDVDPQTGNIDPALVVQAVEDIMHRPSAAARWLPPSLRERGLTIDPSKLKAILPVHAFGQPADMDPILDIAEQYGLSVIEDACEAPGAEYQQRRAGAMGHAAVFAFYPNKQMTTGEGGMIVTSNPEWNALFRSLRNQGRDTFNAWLDHTRLGYNYRLDEMSAAMGLVQLQRIEDILARRAQVAEWYNERLAEIDLVVPPPIAETTTRMSWFVYVVRIKQPAQRNEVMRRLQEVGVPSRPYFVPIHLQPFYREQFGYERGHFPVTEHLGEVSLALPFSSVMSERQVDYVCEQLVRQLS
jgi:dTDP-4-amino-4,6-dideoxygalactose transaminase